MSDDLVKRLRKHAVFEDDFEVLEPAADRIEALEKALEIYGRYVCPVCGGHCSEMNCPYPSCPEILARAALGEKKDG